MATNPVQAKKKFGQNFLVSQFHLNLLESELQRILKSCNPEKVLEIGPGAAALTHLILKNFKGEVEAWEIDSEAIEFLENEFRSVTRLNLISRDALGFLESVIVFESESGKNENSRQADIAKFEFQKFPEKNENWILVSNLPYNVGSRILVDITRLKQPPQGFLVMLQKEVGEKLILKEKNMNLLGSYLNLFWDVKLVGKFPRSAFSPQPNVESVLVRATFKNNTTHELPNPNEALFLLKNLLKYPNKTLVNNLKNLGWDAITISNFMHENELLPDTRLNTSNFSQILALIHQYKV